MRHLEIGEIIRNKDESLIFQVKSVQDNGYLVRCLKPGPSHIGTRWIWHSKLEEGHFFAGTNGLERAIKRVTKRKKKKSDETLAD